MVHKGIYYMVYLNLTLLYFLKDIIIINFFIKIFTIIGTKRGHENIPRRQHDKREHGLHPADHTHAVKHQGLQCGPKQDQVLYNWQNFGVQGFRKDSCWSGQMSCQSEAGDWSQNLCA